MNRIQFFVLTGLSSLVVLLMIGHIVLVRTIGQDQAILNAAQQQVNQGQGFQKNLQQLAMRIVQDSQSKNDQQLKDLLARNQITFTPGPAQPEAGTPSTAPTR